MLKILCLLLFAVSFLGYFHFLVNVKKVSIFAAPVVIVTSISAIMCMAGLVNTMPVCVYLILAAGIFLLLKYRSDFSVKPLSGNKFPLVLCAVLLVYLVYYTKGAVYADGDTMTHWGVIVKNIYRNGRLPNFSDIEIEYQAYPPATACWIYFVIRLLDYSEARALLAQGLWMYACAISMFAVNRSRNKLGDILIFLFSIYLMTGLDNLRVDVILSLVTIAALIIVITNRHDLTRMTCLLIPFLTVLPLIKNSGIFFAILVICMAVFLPAHTDKREQKFKLAGIFVLVTIASWYLWKSHTQMVYESANWTMHSFSAEYMKGVFSSKSAGDIQQILSAFAGRWFSFNDSHEWLAAILFGILTIAVLGLSQEKREVKTVFFVTSGCYLLYKICLFFMYLFSMAGSEALQVASYERYQQTFTMIMLFIALWLYLEYVQVTVCNGAGNLTMVKSICACMITVICCDLAFVHNASLLRPNYNTDGIHRMLTSQIEADGEMDAGDKVIVYDNYPFTYYLVRHSFDNRECNSTYDIEKVEEALTTNNEQYEWLIILDKDKQVKEILNRYGYSEDVTYIPLLDWSE